MRQHLMSEPASAAAGSYLLYKLGVMSGFVAVLAAIVVMAMTVPKTVREFVVALISTVVSSLLGGAFVIRWFDMGNWVNDDLGLAGLGAVIFMCGLPAWVIVRGWFAYTEASKGRSLLEMITAIREALGYVVK